jgi:hypothetical protein
VVRFFCLSCLSILFCSALFLPAVRADSVEDAARALARKVAPLLASHEHVRLSWQNDSLLSAGQSELLRRAFSADLMTSHISLSEDPAASELLVSLRETPAELLLIAAIPDAGDTRQIRMVQVPRSDIPGSDRSSSAFRLQRELLWQQAGPILAAAETQDSAKKQDLLLLLQHDSLALYRVEAERWLLQDSVTLEPFLRPSRDSSGQVLIQGEEAQVLVPGRICTVHLGTHLSLACRPGTPAWRENVLTLSSCDGAAVKFVPGSGDWSTPDHLQPAEDGSGTADSSGSRLDVAGPILSLSGEGNARGIAVVYNLSSGNYEVYRITLACGN